MLQAPFPPGPTAILIGFGLVGLALVGRGLTHLTVAYRLWRTSPARIADVPNERGPLSVTGAASVDRGPVTAPFSGSECLICEWTVEEESRDDHGRDWETVASGVAAVPFRVDDGTASVLVDPAGADLRLADELIAEVPGGETPPEPIRQFIEGSPDVGPEDGGIDLGPVRIATGDDRRYREARLDPGEAVSVYGLPTYAPGSAREAGQVNARFEARRERSLLPRALGGLSAVPLLIADADDDRAVRRVARDGLFPLALGLACLGIAAAFGTLGG